jgi:hypothetical protein
MNFPFWRIDLGYAQLAETLFQREAKADLSMAMNLEEVDGETAHYGWASRKVRPLKGQFEGCHFLRHLKSRSLNAIPTISNVSRILRPDEFRSSQTHWNALNLGCSCNFDFESIGFCCQTHWNPREIVSTLALQLLLGLRESVITYSL